MSAREYRVVLTVRTDVHPAKVADVIRFRLTGAHRDMVVDVHAVNGVPVTVK